MKVRKRKVSTQIFFILTLLLIVTDLIIGSFFYQRTKSLLIYQIKENTKSIASTAAATVDGKAFSELKAGDEGTEDYQKIMDSLAVFRDNSNVEYIYSTRRNEDGTVVYVVDTDLEAGADIDQEFGDEGDAFATAMNGEPAANDKPYSDEWGVHLSACAPIYDGSTIVGVVSVDISMDWVNSQLRIVAIFIIGICLIALCISIAMLLVISRMLGRKFEVLDNKLSDLTDGSGDLRKKIEIKSGDEFELISNRINVFMEQIRTLVESVANTSEGVVSSGEILQNTLEENAQTIININDGISSISTNMQECSSASQIASEHLSDTSEQMSEFVKQVEEVELQTQRANDNANASAKMAKEHRNEAISKIQQIQQEVHKATEEAKVIIRVQDIAEEINAIAEKTKILSLNAQIEAARAGDQGRGFAVVAVDVQSLSSMIAKAVSEINEITKQALESVERLSTQSTAMSDFMTKEVVPDYDAFVGIGEEYGESMQDIEQNMLELKQASSDISQIIGDININIQSSSSTVGASAIEVHSLSDSSADISDRMQSLQEGSAQNVLQSFDLNKQVKKYQY